MSATRAETPISKALEQAVGIKASRGQGSLARAVHAQLTVYRRQGGWVGNQGGWESCLTEKGWRKGEVEIGGLVTYNSARYERSEMSFLSSPIRLSVTAGLVVAALLVRPASSTHQA